jgi:predicted F0F1-ATPase subunit
VTDRPDRFDTPRSPDGPVNGDANAGGTFQKAARARVDAARTLGTLGAVGLSFVVAIVLGTALGLWLDRVTGWSPAFFLIGFVLGLAAGILNVYRAMSSFRR